MNFVFILPPKASVKPTYFPKLCSWICFGGNIIKCCIQPKGLRGLGAEVAQSDEPHLSHQQIIRSHWELQVDETRKRLEYREKYNKPQQLHAKATVWLIYTEISFHIQEDKSQFSEGRGGGERITGKKIIPKLNMCQCGLSLSIYIYMTNIQC